jgi:hypothetical protein
MTPATLAELPPHPRLLLNAHGVDELKVRVESLPFAKKYWETLKTRIDASIDQKIDLPPRGGNWWHWYICPTHAVRLQQGEQISPWHWKFICPVDHEVIESDPKHSNRDFDGCIINDIHDQYADLIRDCGLLYQVTREKKYATKARDILLAYAEKYPTYPLHNIHGEPKLGGGKIGPQTLDESTWLIPVCQGADLIWDTLSDADREALAKKLFEPAARDVIMPHHLKEAVHNIQCWKNSAVGLVGLLLDDKELIDNAIDNPDRGYRTQLAKGVTPDGTWWEGAWGYHFYTLSALWPLAEAGRNCGIDLLDANLKKMFDASLVFAMPNLVLPNFNDSGLESLRGQASTYEWANARFDNADYSRILSKSDRQNTMALLFGRPTLAEPGAQARGSSNHEGSGYAILQTNNTWLCLKYGPDGGWHGHFDKLHFILYHAGDIVMPDSGTTRYGTPLHNEWYRTTLAHNTLLVDETSQKPATGKSLAFSAGPTPYIMADAGDIAAGVKFIRTAVMLNENLVVFIDDVKCGKPHTLDLAIHAEGSWQDNISGTPWKIPSKDGYKHLTGATSRDSTDGVRLAVAKTTAIHVAPGDKTEVITAMGLGTPPTHKVPVAILRRKAQATRYIWAISLAGQDVELKPSAEGVDVTSARKSWRISVDPSAGRCDINSM